MHSASAMVNLVGEGGDGTPFLAGSAEILRQPGTFIHLYGKAKTRTGRKMGHVTVCAAAPEEVDRAVAVIKAHGKVVPLTIGSQEKETAK